MTAKPNRGGRPRTRPKATAFDVEVGKRIHTRREEIKMSPEAFAGKLRKSVSQIYRYESGDSTISTPILTKMAGILRCNVSALVDGIKVPK